MTTARTRCRPILSPRGPKTNPPSGRMKKAAAQIATVLSRRGVSAPGWEGAGEEVVVEEKEVTRARDALAARRRRMPRMAVDKDYLFDGPNGPAGLRDLFADRRQLVVYRFFFQPDVDGWPDKGCP